MEPQFFHDATPATVLSLLLPLVPVILAYALRQHDVSEYTVYSVRIERLNADTVRLA